MSCILQHSTPRIYGFSIAGRVSVIFFPSFGKVEFEIYEALFGDDIIVLDISEIKPLSVVYSNCSLDEDLNIFETDFGNFFFGASLIIIFLSLFKLNEYNSYLCVFFVFSIHDYISFHKTPEVFDVRICRPDSAVVNTIYRQYG